MQGGKIVPGWRQQLDQWTYQRLGRRVSHVSPRYVRDRLREAAHRVRRPTDPWLAVETIHALDTLLSRTDVGIEFGAGNSTCWLASRVQSLISIEHSARWAASVQNMIRTASFTNVDLHLVNDQSGEPDASQYLAPLNDLSDGHADFVLVDGIHRDACMLRAIDLLRPGGILVLDNAERYIPSSSTSPEAGLFTRSDEWIQVEAGLENWRYIWTTNGVFDAGIWIKPCSVRRAGHRGSVPGRNRDT